MEIIETSEGLLLQNVDHFQLDHTFLCGQCFRWNRVDNHRYIGIAGGHLLDMTAQENGFLLKNTTRELWQTFWCRYLALDMDYHAIERALSRDNVLAKAMAYGHGIRILRQDFWETLVSFLMAQANNITRIKGIISRLCENFGHPISYEGHTYYTFPTPSDLFGVSREELSCLRAGYRERYLYELITAVQNGTFFPAHVAQKDFLLAKKDLLSLYGVGEKVANCILLFGLSHFEAFPIDVWVRRVMEYYYFGGQKTPIRVIADFAKKQFGDYGGFAQQYLFYYARETGLGLGN